MVALVAVIYETKTGIKRRHVVDDANDAHVERARVNLHPDESLVVLPVAGFPKDKNGSPIINMFTIIDYAAKLGVKISKP